MIPPLGMDADEISLGILRNSYGSHMVFTINNGEYNGDMASNPLVISHMASWEILG